MEQLETLLPTIIQRAESSQPFIVYNTLETTLDEMRNDHIIPVFTKDNETLISHVEFIENVEQIASEIFDGETILNPSFGYLTQSSAEFKKQKISPQASYIHGDQRKAMLRL